MENINIEDELVELIDLRTRFDEQTLTWLENLKETYSPKNIEKVSYNANSGMLTYTFLGETFSESLHDLLSDYDNQEYNGFSVMEFTYDETSGKMHVTFATKSWPLNSHFYLFHSMLMSKVTSEEERVKFRGYICDLESNERRKKSNEEVLKKYKLDGKPQGQPGGEG